MSEGVQIKTQTLQGSRVGEAQVYF